MADDCLGLHDTFDGGDQFVDGEGFSGAEVIDVKAGRGVHGGEESFDGILHVREVSGEGAIAKDGDRLMGEHGPHEPADGEIGALSWAVDGKESANGDGDGVYGGMGGGE